MPLRLVGMNVDSLDDTRVAAVTPGRIKTT
jgi:hypothetical protein